MTTTVAPAQRQPGRAARARSRRRDGARDRHPDRPAPRDPRRDDQRTPTFLFSSDGFRDLLLTPSLLLLVAVGQAIVIITRNVDLSVGSILGLTAYLTGRLFIDVPGIPLIVVFLAGLRLRRAARADQRRAGRVREGSRARDHPRHALHLPRHQRRLDGQRPHQRLRPAGRLPRHSAPAASSASRSSRSSPSSCSSSPPGTCATCAAAASSTRSAPTPPPRTSTASG